eukprot:tig00021374_g21099.t1
MRLVPPSFTSPSSFMLCGRPARAGLVMIRALAEGAAVLRVGYRDKLFKVEAFLKIVVREVIVPAAPTLHVGARLRFQPTQGGEGGA